MSTENEDLSESLAAELTGSTGMTDSGQDMPDSVVADIHDQEQYLAEKDIPVSNDVDDTRQGELDREVEQEQIQQHGRKVPLAALHEERQRRQALELQLQAQAQQLQQLLAQQQAVQQAQLQAQQEAEIPSFEDDPQGYILAREKQFRQELENLKGGQGQPQQVPVQQLEAQVLQEAAVYGPAVSEAEARFEAVNPDYQQAFDHVWQTVDANLRAAHPGVNEQQLGMLRTANLVDFAKTCRVQGIDPAARIYESAQKLGFKPASRAPRKEPPTSLANAHGSSRAPDERGNVRASDISEMSEAEFDKFWKEMKQSSVVGPKY